MPRRAILLFTKASESGEAKSRLKPVLSSEQRRELHLAFLQDLAVSIKGAMALISGAELVLCSTTAKVPGELDSAFSAMDYTYLQQHGASFKERLVNATSDVFALGYSSCVVLGSDCVEASGRDIAGALHLLESADIVAGPSGDGGFYIAGVKAGNAALFDIEGYGTPKALDNLVARASQLSLSCRFLEACDDIDTLFDLQRFYRKASHAENGCLAQATFAVLERLAAQGIPVNEKPISIVVPVLNEAGVVEQLCSLFAKLERYAEVIVVDGGSTDGTLQALDGRFRLISSPKGRGTQLNAAARTARGEVLLFLHADSIIEPDGLEKMRKVLAVYRAGCFKVAFPRSTAAMACCQALSNFRAKRRHIMFGDQGIFIERSLFCELGGFRDIPLMEDYQLSLDLLQRGIDFGVADAYILTSDRRFRGGLLHQLVVMRQMAQLRKRYRNGEDPAVLAAEYHEIR